MNEFSDARWPAERHARVHHIQARKAFEPGSAAYPGRLISAVDGTAVVERSTPLESEAYSRRPPRGGRAVN